MRARVLQLPMKPELQAQRLLLRQLLLAGQGQGWSMARAADNISRTTIYFSICDIIAQMSQTMPLNVINKRVDHKPLVSSAVSIYMS